MPVKIEQIAYKGWENCWRMTNERIELIVTADVGPRVIACSLRGGQNLFKNYDEQMGGRGELSWMIRGGSRIWIGPEDPTASYAPDNSPVAILVEGNRLMATAPVEESVRIQKQMVIHIAEGSASVEIRHRIRNAGLMPTEFAVWVLTVMTPGGVAITGFPPRGTHPENLAPSNPLIMWPFTDLSDPRWKFLKKYLILSQDSQASAPQKIGHFNPSSWGAYLLGNELFIKRCTADPQLRYPDFGSSYQTFTNADMLELETLGPLKKVLPGEWVEHVERWSVHPNISLASWTDDELDRVLAPLV